MGRTLTRQYSDRLGVLTTGQLQAARGPSPYTQPPLDSAELPS